MMDGVYTPFGIRGTKMEATYDYLGAKGAFPLHPIVVHSSFCFPSTSLIGNSLGMGLTLGTAKGKS